MSVDNTETVKSKFDISDSYITPLVSRFNYEANYDKKCELLGDLTLKVIENEWDKGIETETVSFFNFAACIKTGHEVVLNKGSEVHSPMVNFKDLPRYSLEAAVFDFEEKGGILSPKKREEILNMGW